LYVSEAVLDEIRSGDSTYATKRLELIGGLDVLRYSVDVRDLALEYEQRLGLSGAAIADLPHFAYSVAYNMDYLLTWNCRHIANSRVVRRLLEINDSLGRKTPLILTPMELMADLSEEDQ
jgi:hypothetical protein